MGEKIKLNGRIDSNVMSELDDVLEEFHKVTGIKPVKQESLETAIKDYTSKIKKQITLLKTDS